MGGMNDSKESRKDFFIPNFSYSWSDALHLGKYAPLRPCKISNVI